MKKNSFNSTYLSLRRYAEDNKLVYPNLIKNDWFFRKILRYESRHTYKVSLTIITLFFLLTLLSGIIEKVFINESLAVDMFHDIGFWMIIIVDYVLVCLSIIIFRNFSKLFIQLYKNNMIKPGKEEFNKFFERINKKFNKKVCVLFCYLLGFGVFLFQYRSMPLTTSNTWHVPQLIGKISITSLVFIPLNLFHQILIIQFLIRSVFISFTMILFFINNRLQIDFSSKREKDISAIDIIGKYALKNFILIFLLSLFLAASLYSNTKIYDFSPFNVYNIILISEYLLCSFVSIFSPIFLFI